MQLPLSQAAPAEGVPPQSRCGSPCSAVSRSGLHSRLSQLSSIHAQEADGLASVDEFSSSFAPPCASPGPDDDTGRWVERLRLLVQQQRASPPRRPRSPGESDVNAGASGCQTQPGASGSLRRSGLSTYLWRNCGPRRLTPPSAARRPATSCGAPRTETALGPGWAQDRRWCVTLTTGVVGAAESAGEFMTLECMSPTRTATTFLLDEAVVIRHLKRLVAPLSYVVRAVFYYSEELGGYVPLSHENCRSIGCQFRVFVVPTNARTPAEKKPTTPPTAACPSTASREEGGRGARAARPSSCASSPPKLGGVAAASLSAPVARVLSSDGSRSACGVARTAPSSNISRVLAHRAPAASSQGAPVDAARVQDAFSCDAAPRPFSACSVVAAPPLSVVERLRGEIADGIARLHSIAESTPPRGLRGTGRGVQSAGLSCDFTHDGGAGHPRALKRRYSFHPPLSVYAGAAGKAQKADGGLKEEALSSVRNAQKSRQYLQWVRGW
ncbi:uncharacterized protein Tco025E_02388 [Trypanosoma conorhini]|uniref:Uncharacterized protein n=1 Tax=Trypanosoma conorhini TaxID=83891 RepID=A0A3R7NP80_9TRYP|nr:uncharacterized protein Tco025E_02388 [Trypanosoma conorhini]RNF24912.1 hypothetical protein Tco025E_02388 [Trypanosoma conorhini]